MKKFNFIYLFLLISWAYKQTNAPSPPYVKGAHTVPSGKKLAFNPDLSDEFHNETNFDRNDWETSSPALVQNYLLVKGATGPGFIYSVLSGRRTTKVNINSHNNLIDVSGLKTGQYTLTVNHTSFFNFIKKIS